MTDPDHQQKGVGNDAKSVKNHNGKKRNYRRNRYKKKQKAPNAVEEASSTGTKINDENLPPNVAKDPRGTDPSKFAPAKGKQKKGRNTESFDPKSTLVRPDVRIRVGLPTAKKFGSLKHDDVVIVPNLFGPEEDWSIYYKLMEEMTELQQSQVKGSEFISWHEGCHLVAKDPSGSKTFNEVIDRLCEYFSIRKSSLGVRFNWYTSSTDWKPFHHDSAAFNKQRAQNQNITVGVSFGSTRELAFLRASDSTEKDEVNQPCRLYFPQPNNGVFTFGRDVNIRWKHGINALPEECQSEKGRISIIVWGLAEDVIEEEGSPPMLGADGKGPHAAGKNHGKGRNRRRKQKRKNAIEEKNIESVDREVNLQAE